MTDLSKLAKIPLVVNPQSRLARAPQSVPSPSNLPELPPNVDDLLAMVDTEPALMKQLAEQYHSFDSDSGDAKESQEKAIELFNDWEGQLKRQYPGFIQSSGSVMAPTKR
ncbi:hypothetical protein DAMA08_000520 [Martiniozyma asiatica (nom. inval.)]|nr:hypothetical protein DAMA08_000520 [Martiniozyma asiatica]